MKKILLLLLTTFIFAQPDGYDCIPDACGICTGGQNPCFAYNEFLGCDYVCFSGKEIDACGVCNLDSSLLNLGDLNNDNDINVTDIVMTVSTILASNTFNTLADLDGNCTNDVVDIVAIINQIIYAFPTTLLYSNDPASMTPTQTRTTIQDHINDAANQGKDLLFEHPDLTYTIDGTITIPSDIKIDFNNSRIKRESGNDIVGDVFDMLVNQGLDNGNENIVLKNLTIDGNRFNDQFNDTDDLYEHEQCHWFSGLKLINVINSTLINITVELTQNAEQNQWITNCGERAAGGIFFTNGQEDVTSQYPGCNNIYCNNINAYHNDRTGIIIHNSQFITIDGSDTAFNAGSGIGSQNSDNCNFYNITSQHNGYSNISINGTCCVVNELTTSKSAKCGLNIGHNNEPALSDYSIIKNVTAFENELEGIMIRNADYVQLADLTIKNNKRNNFKIQNDVFEGGVYYDASNIRIKDSSIFGYYESTGGGDDSRNFSGGYGLRIQGVLGWCTIFSEKNEDDCTSENGSWTALDSECGGHIIEGTEIYNNWFNGIGVIQLEGDCFPSSMNASVWVGDDVNIYNNGRADEFESYEGGVPYHEASGIRLDGSKNSEIYCPVICSCSEPDSAFYCDEAIDNTSYDYNVCSQNYGIHILGGGDHTIQVWDTGLIYPDTPASGSNNTYNTCTP